MKIAVVGANGFLGREITKNLSANGEEVLCVFHYSADNIPAGLGKIRMADFLKGKEEVNGIFFSAGSFKNSIEQNNQLNCEDLYQLTKVYRNSRFLFVSSANVYGSTSIKVSEDSAFHNPGDYGRSKLSAETIVSGLPSFAIVRLVYLYGKGLNNGSFLPFIIKNAKETGEISLYGGGTRKQDYLHVRDAADLCIKAFFSGRNEVFLGASGESKSNYEVAEIFCENFPEECRIKFIDKPESSISLFYDPKWTKQQLNWEPRTTFIEGLKEMIS